MKDLSVNELLDAVKARHKITSDYKLAAYLGLTLGAISHYRHGRSLPDERGCQKIADALGIDADVLAAKMLARRAQTTEARTLWERVAQRLEHGVAAVLLLPAVAIIFGALQSDATWDAGEWLFSSEPASVYYVKL